MDERENLLLTNRVRRRYLGKSCVLVTLSIIGLSLLLASIIFAAIIYLRLPSNTLLTYSHGNALCGSFAHWYLSSVNIQIPYNSGIIINVYNLPNEPDINIPNSLISVNASGTFNTSINYKSFTYVIIGYTLPGSLLNITYQFSQNLILFIVKGSQFDTWRNSPFQNYELQIYGCTGNINYIVNSADSYYIIMLNYYNISSISANINWVINRTMYNLTGLTPYTICNSYSTCQVLLPLDFSRSIILIAGNATTIYDIYTIICTGASNGQTLFVILLIVCGVLAFLFLVPPIWDLIKFLRQAS